MFNEQSTLGMINKKETVPANQRTAEFNIGQQPRFQNITKYFQANKPAGQQMAQQLQQSVGQQVQKAADTSAFTPIQKTLEEQASQFSDKNVQNLVQQIKSNPQSVFSDPNRFKQAQQLLSGANSSQELRNSFQNAYNQFQQQNKAASEQVQNLGTESGRFGLLQKRFNSPGYTQGQGLLDQALVQTGGGGAIGQAQQQMGASLGQAQQTAEALSKTVNPQIQALSQKAQLASSQLQGTLADQISGFKQQQESEAAGLTQKASDIKQAWSTLSAPGGGWNKLTQEQKDMIEPLLKNVGLNPETTSLAGVDPSQFNILGKTQYTTQDVVSKPELQRIEALSSLAQQGPVFTASGEGEQALAMDPNIMKAVTEAQAKVAPQIQKAQVDQQFLDESNKLLADWNGLGGDWENMNVQSYLMNPMRDPNDPQGQLAKKAQDFVQSRPDLFPGWKYFKMANFLNRLREVTPQIQKQTKEAKALQDTLA